MVTECGPLLPVEVVLLLDKEANESDDEVVGNFELSIVADVDTGVLFPALPTDSRELGAIENFALLGLLCESFCGSLSLDFEGMVFEDSVEGSGLDDESILHSSICRKHRSLNLPTA